MKLPRKFFAGVITVAAAAGVVGLAGCDNPKSSAPQQQTAVTQTVQQTAPDQQATPAQQADLQQADDTPPDTFAEQQAKLAAMEAYDQQLLLADGYKATARLDYGNGSGNPPTSLLDPGLHYHGTSTCIEYAAVVNGPVAPPGFQVGQRVHIYVQHHGVSGDVTHSKFTTQSGPALHAK